MGKLLFECESATYEAVALRAHLSTLSLRACRFAPIRSNPIRIAAIAGRPLVANGASIVATRCLGCRRATGLFADLAEAPVHVEALADRFELQPQPLRMMLDVLVAEQYLECRETGTAVTPAIGVARSGAPTSVTTMLSSTLDYWDWWTELDQVVAGDAVGATKPASADEIGWARRVHTQFELRPFDRRRVRRRGRPAGAGAVDRRSRRRPRRVLDGPVPAKPDAARHCDRRTGSGRDRRRTRLGGRAGRGYLPAHR